MLQTIRLVRRQPQDAAPALRPAVDTKTAQLVGPMPSASPPKEDAAQQCFEASSHRIAVTSLVGHICATACSRLLPHVATMPSVFGTRADRSARPIAMMKRPVVSSRFALRLGPPCSRSCACVTTAAVQRRRRACQTTNKRHPSNRQFVLLFLFRREQVRGN